MSTQSGGYMLKFWVLAYVLTLAVPARAEPIALFLDATAKDTVGQSFVYEIREKLRKSSGLKFVSSSSDALFVLHIITQDTDPKDQQFRTIYAANLVLYHKSELDGYINQWIGHCGKAVLTDCATNIIAGVDTSISDLIREASEASKK